MPTPMVDTRIRAYEVTPRSCQRLDRSGSTHSLLPKLLKGADPLRYKSLWTSLENDISLAVDKYPTTISKAMSLLTTWKDPNAKKDIYIYIYIYMP